MTHSGETNHLQSRYMSLNLGVVQLGWPVWSITTPKINLSGCTVFQSLGPTNKPIDLLPYPPTFGFPTWSNKKLSFGAPPGNLSPSLFGVGDGGEEVQESHIDQQQKERLDCVVPPMFLSCEFLLCTNLCGPCMHVSNSKMCLKNVVYTPFVVFPCLAFRRVACLHQSSSIPSTP